MSLSSALNIGSSGLDSSTQDLDVVGNNIANASTYGFKESRVDFAEAFAQSLIGGTGQIGTGAEAASVENILTQGTLDNTGVVQPAEARTQLETEWREAKSVLNRTRRVLREVRQSGEALEHHVESTYNLYWGLILWWVDPCTEDPQSGTARLRTGPSVRTRARPPTRPSSSASTPT